MTASLRHVDPTRPPGALVRAYSALGTTQLARFISRHVNWKLDPFLLGLTRGRLASTLMVPSAVPGAATHPAWYHNLRRVWTWWQVSSPTSTPGRSSACSERTGWPTAKQVGG